MRPEIAVLDIQGQYRVYTEFHRADAAEKTIILINGSLATTASFAQTVRNLHPQFNVVLYDQPYAGKSKPHNRQERLISKETEAHILLELIEHFQADHVMSFSWGGACTLLALAHQPRQVKKAVVSSFSPVINAPMRDYLDRGCQYLAACDRYQVGNLVNDTIGKHLPSRAALTYSRLRPRRNSARTTSTRVNQENSAMMPSSHQKSGSTKPLRMISRYSTGNPDHTSSRRCPSRSTQPPW